MKLKQVFPLCLSMLSMLLLFSVSDLHSHFVSAHRLASYDISQFQGHLSNNQAKRLKREVHFMILRGEYGQAKDTQLTNNIKIMNKNKIPYGVYDYSIYHNASQAKAEANKLYLLAPHANFYINDAEENRAGSNFNVATRSWSYRMRHISHKPTVLYSGSYFMKAHMTTYTRRSYNANWIAAYGAKPAQRNYDLWQFTSSHHSKALDQNVDADVIPSQNSHKPLSFWTGSNNKSNSVSSNATYSKPKSTVVHEVPLMKAIKPAVHVRFQKI